MFCCVTFKPVTFKNTNFPMQRWTQFSYSLVHPHGFPSFLNSTLLIMLIMFPGGFSNSPCLPRARFAVIPEDTALVDQPVVSIAIPPTPGNPTTPVDAPEHADDNWDFGEDQVSSINN